MSEQTQQPDPTEAAEAYDEMLRAVCAAHIGNADDCALICGDRCAGEEGLLRWAERYDGAVRVAREDVATARAVAELAVLTRQAQVIRRPPEVWDLAAFLNERAAGLPTID